MALTLAAHTESVATLEEYLELMDRHIPVNDIDAIVDTSERFAALLKNENLMIDSLNAELSTTHPNARFRASSIDAMLHLDEASAPSLIERAMRDEHPFVRAYAEAAQVGPAGRAAALG